jgi:hypothetical protein
VIGKKKRSEMSLTSHLNNPTSPIGQFIKRRFVQTARLTKVANLQLKAAETLRPALSGVSYPYAPIGTTIDYRIRYAFDVTPYQQLVAWQGALLLATKPVESNHDIVVDEDELLDILTLTPISFDIMQGVAQGPYPLKLVRQFFESLDATLQTMQPVGRLLDAEAEHLLDRFCVVLSFFEQVFRSNAYLQGPLLLPTVKQSVEELLTIPQDSWLDDLSQMFSLFYARYHDLLSRPYILHPTFAGSFDIGGADADLVVDGCLIDIKASVSPQIKAEYLYQLAGHLLLDYDDQLHMNAVAIYMARQGMLFTWSVAEFLHQLTGNDSAELGALRREFRKLFQGI